MRSRPRMIHHCSIKTIAEISEEVSFTRTLCESKVGKMFSKPSNLWGSWSKRYLVEKADEKITIVFSDEVIPYKIAFYKVTNDIVKCEVETVFKWGVWLVWILLSIAIGYFADKVVFSWIGMLLIFLMFLFASVYYKKLEMICLRIQKNYERDESLLKLNALIMEVKLYRSEEDEEDD